MPTPFISVSDLGSYLGRDVSADAGALIAVDAACEICRAEAGQDFNRGTTTGTVDGTGTDAIVLRQVPVNAVTAVTVAGAAITDYVVDGQNGKLLRGTAGTYPRPVWPEGRQNVTVTYDHGWDTANLPRSVAMVALSIAARLVTQGPAIQESIGNVTVRYGVNSTDLTAGERLILGKFRRT